jgi:hypothetical protein
MNQNCYTITVVIDKNLPGEIYTSVQTMFSSLIVFMTPYVISAIVNVYPYINSVVNSVVAQAICGVISVLIIGRWIYMRPVIAKLKEQERIEDMQRMQRIEELDQKMRSIKEEGVRDMELIIKAFLKYQETKTQENEEEEENEEQHECDICSGKINEAFIDDDEEDEEKDDPTYNPEEDDDSDSDYEEEEIVKKAHRKPVQNFFLKKGV